MTYGLCHRGCVRAQYPLLQGTEEPPPPPRTKGTVNTKFTKGQILLGHFWCRNFKSQTPPPSLF